MDLLMASAKLFSRHRAARLPLANPDNFCENNSLSYPCQKD
jgi:hypothetical protein